MQKYIKHIMQTNMMRGEYLHQVALNGNLQQCLV